MASGETYVVTGAFGYSGRYTSRRLLDAGVSVRTLQTASQSVCGMAVHRYTRLRRLWSVRRQLRTGATGLTVKASALAHGFWHLSQFTNA